MRGRGPAFIALLSITVAVGMAACGGDDDDDGRTTASDGGRQSAAASGPAELAGTYRFEIEGEDFWIAELTADGRFVQRLGGEQLDAEGNYRIRGDEILVRDTASGVGTFCERVGTYRWRLDGDRLVMKEVDDPCEGREDLWTRVWTKIE